MRKNNSLGIKTKWEGKHHPKTKTKTNTVDIPTTDFLQLFQFDYFFKLFGILIHVLDTIFVKLNNIVRIGSSESSLAFYLRFCVCQNCCFDSNCSVYLCVCMGVFVCLCLRASVCFGTNEYERIYKTKRVLCAHPFELMFSITMKLSIPFTWKGSVQKIFWFGSHETAAAATAYIRIRIHMDTCSRARKPIEHFVHKICMCVYGNVSVCMYEIPFSVKIALHAHVPSRNTGTSSDAHSQHIRRMKFTKPNINEQQFTNNASEKERARVSYERTHAHAHAHCVRCFSFGSIADFDLKFAIATNNE